MLIGFASSSRIRLVTCKTWSVFSMMPRAWHDGRAGRVKLD
jgi:hypothetical protein